MKNIGKWIAIVGLLPTLLTGCARDASLNTSTDSALYAPPQVIDNQYNNYINDYGPERVYSHGMNYDYVSDGLLEDDDYEPFVMSPVIINR